MAASTNRALAVRAVRAANFLEFWAKELRDEMKKQNIEFDPDIYEDGTTVMVSRKTVTNLILNMREIARNIRSFKAPKGSN
jgi:hypothetical protein